MPEKEEQVVASILERYPYLSDHLHISRRQRIYADPLPRREFEEVFDYLTSEGGFYTLKLIIGVDDGDDLGILYPLTNGDKILLLMKQRVPKANPVIRSVYSRFPSILWYEREIVDLFGVIVEELPPGPTYPLPDGWPAGNYPLRKEWKVEYFDKKTMTYNPPQSKENEATDKEV